MSPEKVFADIFKLPSSVEVREIALSLRVSAREIERSVDVDLISTGHLPQDLFETNDSIKIVRSSVSMSRSSQNIMISNTVYLVLLPGVDSDRLIQAFCTAKKL